MKTKICLKCNEEKLTTEFHNHSGRKDGLADWCKLCRVILKEETIKTRELLKNGFKKCPRCNTIKNVAEFNKKGKFFVSHCKVCKRNYYDNHKEELKQKAKIYREKNSDKYKKYDKAYNLAHPEERKLLNKIYRNKPENKKRRAEQKRERTKIDINFKLSGNLRSRVNQALNGNTKSKQTLELLGCSVEFLKNHLEAQFKEGMNWNNYTYYGWHVDHIIPCVKFDLSNPEEQKKCFHYSNLQPLWREENQIKNDS